MFGDTTTATVNLQHAHATHGGISVSSPGSSREPTGLRRQTRPHESVDAYRIRDGDNHY